MNCLPVFISVVCLYGKLAYVLIGKGVLVHLSSAWLFWLVAATAGMASPLRANNKLAFRLAQNGFSEKLAARVASANAASKNTTTETDEA